MSLVTAGNRPGASESERARSGGGHEPVLVEPGALGAQGLAAMIERTEHRPADGGEIRMPAAVGSRFDVAGADDLGAAKGGEVDPFVVDGPDPPSGIDD